MKSEGVQIKRFIRTLLQRSLLRKSMRGGLITSIALLTGCINNVEIGNSNGNPKVGEQLMALHQAHQAGAISDQEYNQLKLKLFHGS